MNIPCTSGFALSVTLAIFVGLETIVESSVRESGGRASIVDYFKGRDYLHLEYGYAMSIFLSQLLPSLGLSLLMGMGLNPSVEEHWPYKPIHPWAFTVFGFLFLLWIVVATWQFARDAWSDYLSNEASPIYPHLLRITATNALVFPGMVLLALNYKKCVEPLDYRGPMYILATGVDTEYVQATYDEHYKVVDPAYNRYHAKVRVAFGSEWACSGNDQSWCESWASISECNFCSIGNVGEARCPQGSEWQSSNCLQTSAFPDLIYWSDQIGWPTPYDDSYSFRKEVRPDEETTQWPVGQFHGDCNTCEAFEVDTYDKHLTYSRRMRLAAVIPIGLGFLIIIVDVLVKIIHARKAMPAKRIAKEENENTWSTFLTGGWGMGAKATSSDVEANAVVGSSSRHSDHDHVEFRIRRPPGHSSSFHISSSEEDTDIEEKEIPPEWEHDEPEESSEDLFKTIRGEESRKVLTINDETTKSSRTEDGDVEEQEVRTEKDWVQFGSWRNEDHEGDDH